MFSSLAEVNVNIPGTESPWFYLIVMFLFAMTTMGSCITSAVIANRKAEAKQVFDGFIATAIITGLIGAISLGFTFHIFYRIFSSVLPAAATATGTGG